MRLIKELLPCLFVFILCLSGNLIFGNNYDFRNYTTIDGLSHKTVNCIIRDREGFLWVGTTNGLSRFDGYTFKNYLNDESDSLSLDAYIVFQIVEDKEGNIWLATNNGIKYFERHYETFHSVCLPGVGGNISISGITCDDDGTIWACHSNLGLFIVNKNGENVSAKQYDLSQYVKVDNYLLTWRVLSADGFLWVSTSDGLLRLNSKEKKAQYVSIDKKMKFCTSLRSGSLHEVIVTSYEEGVYVLNTSTLGGYWLGKELFVAKGVGVVKFNDAL